MTSTLHGLISHKSLSATEKSYQQAGTHSTVFRLELTVVVEAWGTSLMPASRFALVVVTVLGMVFGCNKSVSTSSPVQQVASKQRATMVRETVSVGDVVSQFGEFKIAGGGVIVCIEPTEQTLFKYSVVDSTGRKLLESKDEPSDAQNWCVAWDKNDCLWFWSSDIGGCVWRTK